MKTIKKVNLLFVIAISLLGAFTNSLNAQKITKNFATFTSDCVVEFDIAPTCAWHDINIRPASGGNDKNTRILLRDAGKIQLFNSKEIASNFKYKVDGTKYNFRVSLYFKDLKIPLVTVEAKEAFSKKWTVLFERSTQISKLPVGMLEVLGKNTSKLHLTKVKAHKMET